MNFFSIPIIPVALAIVISWALFAILCSLIQEGIAQVLADRGRFMKKYLLNQFQDFSVGVNWASMLYLHGTIDLLSRTSNKPTNDISPKLFAESLVEVVGNAHLVQMNIKENQNDYKEPLLYNFKAATQLLDSSDVVTFFKHALNNAEITSTKAGVIDEGIVYQNLISNIENWYTELTERFSLWYKKSVRRKLFFIGIIVGIILNVDTIQLFTVFNTDTAARNTVINFYEKKGDALSAYAQKLNLANPADTSQSFKELIKEGTAYKNSMDSLKNSAALPIGFKESVFKTNESSFGFWLSKLLGILITGMAASFGAPFWFDLLKKIYSKKT